MKKEITLEQVVSYVKDGMTVMVGGFLGVGAPIQIMDALAESGVKNLTVICNDTAFPLTSLLVSWLSTGRLKTGCITRRHQS